MKHLEGKDVYLIGTGNNARRTGRTEPEKAKIIKVARVFVTFRFEGSNWDQKYRMSDGMHLEGDHNGGYKVFESLQEVDDLQETIRLANIISEKFRYAHNWKDLDLETIKKVSDLLGII